MVTPGHSAAAGSEGDREKVSEKMGRGNASYERGKTLTFRFGGPRPNANKTQLSKREGEGDAALTQKKRMTTFG